MWVADMNFQTVPTVAEAIIERTKHRAYGYFMPREEYYDAIINWQKDTKSCRGTYKKNVSDMKNGVLGGVVSALNVFCSRGDKSASAFSDLCRFTHALENNDLMISSTVR